MTSRTFTVAQYFVRRLLTAERTRAHKREVSDRTRQYVTNPGPQQLLLGHRWRRNCLCDPALTNLNEPELWMESASHRARPAIANL
jgi:TnpA family transposase